jgi:hypothetical protein
MTVYAQPGQGGARFESTAPSRTGSARHGFSPSEGQYFKNATCVTGKPFTEAAPGWKDPRG